MKSGSGSSSPNEDVSRYQPYKTAMHRADIRTHTHTHTHIGRMSRASEGVEGRDSVGQQAGRGGGTLLKTQLRTGAKDLSKRTWPLHKDYLPMTCRRTITPPSSTAPRMPRTPIASNLLPPKTKPEFKETRNDSLLSRAAVSYHSRN